LHEAGARFSARGAIRLRLIALSVLVVGLWAIAPLGAQPGAGALDVPFVATPWPAVHAMLKLANTGPKDLVVDLGSGDGRIVIAAARDYGARGRGIELDPQRLEESIRNAAAAGVGHRVDFRNENLFHARIGDATVVTLYLLPRVNLELRPRLLKELGPGARVVSHKFDMGDWKPDLRAKVRGETSEVFLWVIPAQVAGHWRMTVVTPRGEHAVELDLKQKFQEIEGVARREGKAVLVQEARLEGERIAFLLVDDSDPARRKYFEGRVAGREMEGTGHRVGSTSAHVYRWRAVRAH
jgi:SAM-dependent methyltransferase